MIERNLSDFLAMQERCSNCSYCKFIPLDKIKSRAFAGDCPAAAYYKFNAYSARGRFQLGRALNKGEDIDSPGLAELIHSCTGCGACDLSCKICRYNLEPLQHNHAMKTYAVEKDMILPEARAYREAWWASAGSPEAAQEKTEWAQGLGLKDLTRERADVLFFPGCKYSLRPDLRDNVRFAASLLLEQGLDMGILGNAPCCGSQLYQMGFQDDFDRAAAQNIESVKQAGVKTVITPCADCCHAFKRLYAEKGCDVEVLHITQVLDQLVKDGKLTFHHPIPATVTYHDPCHLGRQGEAYIPWDGEEKKILNQIHTWEPRRPRNMGAEGVYDAPRHLLSAIPGVALVEMERIREYSWCCGSGGGCGVTLPEYARSTAASRVEEAVSSGAQVLVTACPGCYQALKAGESDGIQVTDILTMVRQAAEKEGEQV